MEHWKRKSSLIVYDSPFFRVKRDIVELPDGSEKDWTYWDATDGAMVIGNTPEKKLVMIRQYRYLTGGEQIEFPSGAVHEGENVEDCARREFEEESGYSCNELVKIGSFFESCSQFTRKMHLFFSKDVQKSKQRLDTGAEGFEDIKVELVTFNDAVKLAVDNKIEPLPSAMAILLLNEKVNRGLASL